MTKATNLFLNLFRGEDNEMSVELLPLGQVQFLENFLESAESGNFSEFDQVITDLDEWFKEEVEGHTEEDALKLNQLCRTTN